MKVVKLTKFGKTKYVKATPYNMLPTEEYEELLFVSRPEEMYALMSDGLKNKKVVVVTAEDWMKGEPLK
jgi:hypothetical protein